MLDNGGVAWNKYLETPNATYGAHADAVTFWNREKGDCLRIASMSRLPSAATQQHMALRFSHQPSGIEAVAFSVTGTELQPKHNSVPIPPLPAGPLGAFRGRAGQDQRELCPSGIGL